MGRRKTQGVRDFASKRAQARSRKNAQSADSLSLYLQNVGSIPLLSAAEEVRLAKRMEVGVAAGKRLEEAAQTDEVLSEAERHSLERKRLRGKMARRELIEANLRLVVSVAKRYQNNGLPLDDLIEEGNAGLIRAVDKFDYHRGYRFSTMATWWIRQGVTRAIADQGRTVRLPVHVVEEVNKLRRSVAALSQELGRNPSLAEIGERMDVGESRVLELLSVMGEPASLDKPIGDGDDSELGDYVEDTQADDPERIVVAEGMRDAIREALEFLSERERVVLELRFGLDGEDPRTLEEVGRVVGVTRERVRQIEMGALASLRSNPTTRAILEIVP